MPDYDLPMRVLIADDHKLIVEGVKRALGDSPDFEVVGECSSGSQVLPMVGRTNPDIVLLDLRMPGADGLACLSRIRKQHPEVKVVVLSVSTDSFGIPHVRYNVSFQRPARPATSEGQRVLALKSFAERYTERCAAT